MRPIHANLTVTEFKKPDGVYFTRINPIDGGTSSHGVNAAFIDGTSPSRTSVYRAPVENENEGDEEAPTTDGDGGDTPPENEEQPENPGDTTTTPEDGSTTTPEIPSTPTPNE